MSKQARIVYSGFWDVPLAFVVWHEGKQFLFLREFDEIIDDYPDEYRVFLLPDIPEHEIKRHWATIENLATKYLGVVPIKDVNFDQSMREKIDTDVLQRFGNDLDIRDP